LYHFEQLEEATNPLEPDTLLMDNKPLSYPVFKHVHDFATFYREMLVQGEDARFIGQFWRRWRNNRIASTSPCAMWHPS
jgi:hypothetical protein